MHRNTARKLGQIPEGALIVGVDPHKHKHAVVVMTREAEVVAKFKVSVGRDGYAGLMRRVGQLVDERGNSGAMYAIEAGGHYWCSLAAFVDQHGQRFRLINPLTLKRLRDGEDLNRNKSDYRDAEMVPMHRDCGRGSSPKRSCSPGCMPTCGRRTGPTGVTRSNSADW